MWVWGDASSFGVLCVPSVAVVGKCVGEKA